MAVKTGVYRGIRYYINHPSWLPEWSRNDYYYASTDKADIDRTRESTSIDRVESEIKKKIDAYLSSKPEKSEYEIIEKGSKYALVKIRTNYAIVRLSDGAVVVESGFKAVVTRHFNRLENGDSTEDDVLNDRQLWSWNGRTPVKPTISKKIEALAEKPTVNQSKPAKDQPQKKTPDTPKYSSKFEYRGVSYVVEGEFGKKLFGTATVSVGGKSTTLSVGPFEYVPPTRRAIEAKIDEALGASKNGGKETDYKVLEQGNKYALIQQGDMTMVVRTSDGQVVTGSKSKSVVARHFELLEHGTAKESQFPRNESLSKLVFKGIGTQDPSKARKWTDEQLADVEKKLKGIYDTATSEMKKKLESFMKSYDQQNKEWLERLRKGEVTESDYKAWKELQATNRSWMQGMVDTLSNDASNTNQLAMDLLEDRLPLIYAENANMAAYQMESDTGWNTHSFDLYDRDTVRRLATQDPDMLPKVGRKRTKDYRWNQQKIASAITQSVLQGESIPNAAKRLESVMNMNHNAAVRAARTAITGAENGGRIASYKRAKEIGIQLEQQWMATVDERTRAAHIELDGVHVPVGRYFKFGNDRIAFPGDPSAKGYLVWNCRCTLVAWMEGIEAEDPERWTDLPKGVTYDDWKKSKEDEAQRLKDAQKTKTRKAKKASKPRTDRAQPVKEEAPKVAETKVLAGVSRGEPMTHERADRGNVNPRYREGGNYRINCQTCVVAYEARLRGFNVAAKPKVTEHQRQLAIWQGNAWLDPKTGRHRDLTQYTSTHNGEQPTASSFWRWLNEDGTVKEGERYFIRMSWLGGGGHIITMHREGDDIVLYDPQSNTTRRGMAAKTYLWKDRVSYSGESNSGRNAKDPAFMRVDDLEFNKPFVDDILIPRDEVY